MARDPQGERWPEVYRDQPEVFDTFSRAEDRDNKLSAELMAPEVLGRGSLLELGCGTGRWSRELGRGSRLHIAIEPRGGMLALAASETNNNTHWLHAKGQALPLASASMECAFAGFVFANLRPKTRVQVLAETARVLRPGGALWLLENHWDDEFQDLRRRSGLDCPVEVEPLLAEHAFELVSDMETRMEFETEAQAQHVLGTILGPRVHAQLEQHPQRRFMHRICLLRAYPSGPASADPLATVPPAK
ncbi:MAG: ubiquinone/menaquinone biosynthesis C-methylase UbiE [Candidatus Paceibacteria bacterium]|jgi:ubiquinone/menaquinone biosynthesis C-methylase UbiE